VKTLLYKKENTVAKSKEVKTVWSNSQDWRSLAEFSKEDYGSKSPVLRMMMMVMMAL
jgi:uncharacterized Zn finger protein